MDSRVLVSSGLIIVLAVSGLAQADTVAIKRSTGLTVTTTLDPIFQNAISGGTLTVHTDTSSGQDLVNDTWLASGTSSNNWRNYGISPGSPAGVNGGVHMTRFELSGLLPGFTGGRVVKAQLRYYLAGWAQHTGLEDNGLVQLGNRGGYVTFGPWAEGTKDGSTYAYPGFAPAAPGATFNHPNGMNTTNSGPLGWANANSFGSAKDGVQVVMNRVAAAYPDNTISTTDGFVAFDVTAIVQLWANGTANYGFFIPQGSRSPYLKLSEIETTLGSEFQPTLFIEYERNGPPAGVTDLAAQNVDWNRLDLVWTAPSDTPPGPVASYEIRYSTAAIDDTNFESATLLAGPPVPAAPDTQQTFAVTGLAPDTIYWFAIRCTDIAGLVGPLSSPFSVKTGPPDTIAPAGVTDLHDVDTRSTRVTLAWTATGDDGNTGLASGYDLRYSTDPINEANFEAATPVAGLDAPKAPGTLEAVTVRGLLPLTSYYFAVKVKDEVPNSSGLSNVLMVTTPEDLLPPETITDLLVADESTRSITLQWTVPADVGVAGLAGYDIRYSLSPIDDTNWDSATQVTDEPVPGVTRTLQTFPVTGLTPDTQYYLAIKSYDQAEPANVSALSNCVPGHTRPQPNPVVLRRIWVANDRVADTRNRTTIGATFGKAYTPDGVVEPAGDQDRAINAYNNVKRRLYHWGNEPNEVGGRQIEDPNYNLNVFGWALCGRHAQIGCSVLDAMGITNRFIGIAIGSSGHNIYEAFYDGDWHLFDTMTTMYVFDRANPPSVASAQDIKDDSSLMLSAVADGRACPGFLLCGDDLVGFANGLKGYSASDGGVPASHNTDMDLRFGETFSRTWESWVTQHEPLDTGHPGAPYHHEASKDWKDTVNFPYWEPYELNSEQNLALNIVIESSGAGYSKSYRRWANGTDVLAPDFRSVGYQALLNGTPVNIATFNDDGLSPDLHANNPGTASEVVFKISPAFYITDGSISGDFFRNDAGDLLKIYTSTNGTSWTQVWEHSATGTVHLDQFNLRTQIYGQFACWVKIAFTANGSKSDAGVSNLVISTIFEHNKGAMAYLDKGLNRITVTFDNPQDLVGNCGLKVTYRWKEFDGTGWTIDKIHEQYVPTSPFTFNIHTAGSRVPKTESIRMEVVEPPPPCDTIPSTITDLAVADTTDQSVSLTWTAPVDSCNGTGPATAYDLRYSTAPIDAANFDLAAQVSNPPAPGAPGGLESFTVSGLTPSTTYYFAVKVRSLGGALSDLSNVMFADTKDPDIIPPAWVGNLIARTGKASGAIDLTWTATGDDVNTGTAKTYDLRYSTSPISEADFAAATAVTGLPAPKIAGSAEAFTVTGLTGGTRYYFALKVADERPNWSEISNTARAVASVLGEKVLQNGFEGYGGCRDNYTQSTSAGTNYGNLERMRVTGYADLGDVQHGFVKFDLSGIPAGITVRKATLWLYSYNVSKMAGSSGMYAAHRITKDWTESGSCHTNYASGVPWTTPGGDFEATADALSPKKAPKVPSWYEWDVTTRVQAWIGTPTGNFGWLIKAQDETSHNQDEFYQWDTANASFRPKLVLSDYVEPVPGDITDDGSVNLIDLLTLAGAWATTCGIDRTYEPLCDLNADGTVDVIDLLILAENWPQE